MEAATRRPLRLLRIRYRSACTVHPAYPPYLPRPDPNPNPSLPLPQSIHLGAPQPKAHMLQVGPAVVSIAILSIAIVSKAIVSKARSLRYLFIIPRTRTRTYGFPKCYLVITPTLTLPGYHPSRYRTRTYGTAPCLIVTW